MSDAAAAIAIVCLIVAVLISLLVLSRRGA